MGGETDLAAKPKTSYPRRAPGPVGHKISNIYKERISQFTSSGQWEKNNLLA